MDDLAFDTWADLQRIAHAESRARGWYDGEPRPFGVMVALMHSELSEAWDAARRYTGCPSEKIPPHTAFAEEIADTAIRIADTADALGLALWADVALEEGSLEAHLLQANLCLTQALEADRKDLGPGRIAAGLQGAVNHLFAMAHGEGFDLYEVCRAKMAYNRTRGYKHGGKKF